MYEVWLNIGSFYFIKWTLSQIWFCVDPFRIHYIGGALQYLRNFFISVQTDKAFGSVFWWWNMSPSHPIPNGQLFIVNVNFIRAVAVVINQVPKCIFLFLYRVLCCKICLFDNFRLSFQWNYVGVSLNKKLRFQALLYILVHTDSIRFVK
jgi:hypothetical protein